MASGTKTIQSDTVVEVMRYQNEGTVNLLQTFTIIGQRASARLSRKRCRLLGIGVGYPNDLVERSNFGQSHHVKRSNPTTTN
jgi:hypothetical protein